MTSSDHITLTSSDPVPPPASETVTVRLEPGGVTVLRVRGLEIRIESEARACLSTCSPRPCPTAPLPRSTRRSTDALMPDPSNSPFASSTFRWFAGIIGTIIAGFTLWTMTSIATTGVEINRKVSVLEVTVPDELAPVKAQILALLNPT